MLHSADESKHYCPCMIPSARLIRWESCSSQAHSPRASRIVDTSRYSQQRGEHKNTVHRDLPAKSIRPHGQFLDLEPCGEVGIGLTDYVKNADCMLGKRMILTPKFPTSKAPGSKRSDLLVAAYIVATSCLFGT